MHDSPDYIDPVRHGGAGFRIFHNIADVWRLSPEEQMQMLGIEDPVKFDDLKRCVRGHEVIYDQLIVDLHRVHSGLRVETAKAKLGELRVYREKYPALGEEPDALLAQATAASRSACEVCCEAARGHTVSETFRRLCDAHLRAAQAMDAARPWDIRRKQGGHRTLDAQPSIPLGRNTRRLRSVFA